MKRAITEIMNTTQLFLNFEPSPTPPGPISASLVTTQLPTYNPLQDPIEVHISRLDGGDIDHSYSADTIDQGHVRKPFLFNGQLYVATSGIYGPSINEAKAYRLMPESFFDGPTTTTTEKVGHDRGESARKDPKGFYHAVRVRSKGKAFVLNGPPLRFVAQIREQQAQPY